MATYAFTINGVARDLQLGWRVTENANGRNRFDFAMVAVDGSFLAGNEDVVVLTENGERIFGGLIDRPAWAGLFNGSTPGLRVQLSATDFNAYADRITHTADFPEQTYKARLQAIATALSAQGVTLDAGQATGPTIPARSYEDAKIVDILNEAASLASGSGATSWVWNINYSKVLKSIESGTLSAPFNVTETNDTVQGDIAVEQPRPNDYANYIILDGGTGQREVTDTYTGNGVQTAFALTYAIVGHRGYVTNVAVNETLDLAGAGATWTLDPVAGTITRTSAPANGAAISITYTAQFPHRVTADGGAPAAQRVTRKYAIPDLFDVEVMQALADSYLARDMQSPVTVRYKCPLSVAEPSGVHPGQTQTITSAKRFVSGTHLINSVVIANVGGSFVQRTVTAVSSTRLPKTLRESFQQTFGTTGASAGGGVTIISSGGVGGTGTAGTLAKWATTATLGPSLISESGSTVTLAGSLTATGHGTHWLGNGGGTGLHSVRLGNNQSGATMAARLAIDNNVGTVAELYAFSSGYTSSGAAQASGVLLQAGQSGGMSIATDPGDLRFYWNSGSTLRLKGTGATLLPGTNRGLSLGSDAFKYLTLYAEELNVQTLVAREVISTIGGQILVGPTTQLSADLSSGATSMQTKHNDLDNTDTVVLKKLGQVEYIGISHFGGIAAVDAVAEWFEIVGDLTATFTAGRTFTVRGSTGNDGTWTVSTSSYNGGTNRTRITVTGNITNATADGLIAYLDSGPYTFIVTRNLDGSGANAWTAGDAVFNTGTTGDGFIDLYSLTGLKSATQVGPTIVGNVRSSTTWDDWAPRWAIGNLNGLYGYATDTYGVALGVPSAAHILIDPTNGIRIRHNTTNKITLDASGNASFTGSITASSGTIGGWTIGATNLSASNITLSSNGFLALGSGTTRIEMSSTEVTYRFWIGANSPASAAFRVADSGVLTASGATISGSITATSGAIGGWTIGASNLSATNISLNSGAANTAHILVGSGSNAGGLNSANAAGDIIFWGGATHANRAAAAFRVTADGGLTATNATITGAITATSGSFSGSITAASISSSTFSGGTFSGSITASGLTLSGSLDVTGSVTIQTNLYANTDVFFNGIAQVAANNYPLIWNDSTKAVRAKTDGFSGTVTNPTSITIEKGIVTACS